MTSLKTAARIASVFMDHQIVLYGVPDFVLRDNGTILFSKLFESLCAIIHACPTRRRWLEWICQKALDNLNSNVFKLHLSNISESTLNYDGNQKNALHSIKTTGFGPMTAYASTGGTDLVMSVQLALIYTFVAFFKSAAGSQHAKLL